jgi:hypothetical protein
VLADEGCEHFHDNPVVAVRRLRYTLESVDSADAYVLVLVAELIDGASESFRYLALPIQLNGAPGEVEARKDIAPATAWSNVVRTSFSAFKRSAAVKGECPRTSHTRPRYNTNESTPRTSTEHQEDDGSARPDDWKK